MYPVWSLLVADVVKIALQCHLVERGEGEGKEKTDSPVQDGEGGFEGSIDLFRSALNRGRTRHSPVRSHGLAWPEGATFARGVVAHGEHEIELGRDP